MAAWSNFLLANGQKLLRNNGLLGKIVPKNGVVRCMSEHRVFPMQPSRWQYNKTKDLFHFYFMIGAIPVAVIVFCANVFIGPATLTPIPEGYVPKEYEYYRSPITRFLSKYLFPSTQEQYEKYLHGLYVQDHCAKLRLLHTEYKNVLSIKFDYKSYYYRDIYDPKYIYEYRAYLDRELDT